MKKRKSKRLGFNLLTALSPTVVRKMSISLQPCEQSGSPNRLHGQPRVFQGQTQRKMVKKMENQGCRGACSRQSHLLITANADKDGVGGTAHQLASGAQTPQACSEPQKGRFWQNIGRTPFVYPANGPDQLARQMLHFCDGNKHLGKGPGIFDEDCDVTQRSRLGVGRCGFGLGACCLWVPCSLLFKYA